MARKRLTIKTVFLVSFASIIVFCLLVLGGVFVYNQLQKFINNKNYQQCLDEQQAANKVALSYTPIIKQVKMTPTNILIKGVLKNPNVKNIEAKIENDCLMRVVKYNPNTGDFTAEAFFNPQAPACGGMTETLAGARFMFKITPKENSNVCNVPQNLASANPRVNGSCSLDSLDLYTSVLDQKWCWVGGVDLGLGSAPLGELSDAELKEIGLSKNNLCQDAFRTDIRKDKCVNSSTIVKLRSI